MSGTAPQRSVILTEDMKRVVSEQRLGFVATVVKVARALPLDSPACDLGRTEEAVRAQWWSHYARLASRQSAGTATGYDGAGRPLPE